MENKLPDSFIVQQLLETLKRIEQDSQRTLAEIQSLRDGDPEFGYAKATGHAQGMLKSIIISANVNRTFYNNA